MMNSLNWLCISLAAIVVPRKIIVVNQGNILLGKFRRRRTVNIADRYGWVNLTIGNWKNRDSGRGTAPIPNAATAVCRPAEGGISESSARPTDAPGAMMPYRTLFEAKITEHAKRQSKAKRLETF
jgi:hypothetical protein